MAIDWTKIFKRYKGLWVALKDDEVTVIIADKTLRQTIKKAENKGFKNPIFMRVPQKITYFVGGHQAIEV